jgi:hypothetical protein
LEVDGDAEEDVEMQGSGAELVVVKLAADGGWRWWPAWRL